MRSLRLTLVLLLPMAVQAQAGGCISPTTAPMAVAVGHSVHVLSAFAQGENVTVLGWPTYQAQRDSSGEHHILDSLFAGVMVGPGAAPRKIPLPIPGRPFEEPWLLGLSDGAARFLFLVSLPYPEPFEKRDSIEIWTGVLTGTIWSDLRRLTTVGRMARLHTQAVPAALLDGDAVTFAFGETRGGGGVDGVTWVTRSHDQWSVHRDTTMWRWIDYVDFARHRDTVWMTAIGMSLAVERAGGWLSGNSVYLAKRNGSRWSEPVRIADGTAKNFYEPRLLRARDGLYLAWSEALKGGYALNWRGVTEGTDTTTRVSVIRSRITPGSGAWRDILTFTTDDTTGVIARPGPGGLAELGRLRVSQRLPPLVVSGPRGPIAVTLTPTPDDPEFPVVSVFDLRCALGPARPDPYRR